MSMRRITYIAAVCMSLIHWLMAKNTESRSVSDMRQLREPQFFLTMLNSTRGERARKVEKVYHAAAPAPINIESHHSGGGGGGGGGDSSNESNNDEEDSNNSGTSVAGFAYYQFYTESGCAGAVSYTVGLVSNICYPASQEISPPTYDYTYYDSDVPYQAFVISGISSDGSCDQLQVTYYSDSACSEVYGDQPQSIASEFASCVATGAVQQDSMLSASGRCSAGIDSLPVSADSYILTDYAGSVDRKCSTSNGATPTMFTAYSLNNCFGYSAGNRQSTMFSCNGDEPGEVSSAFMTNFYNSSKCTLPADYNYYSDDELFESTLAIPLQCSPTFSSTSMKDHGGGGDNDNSGGGGGDGKDKGTEGAATNDDSTVILYDSATTQMSTSCYLSAPVGSPSPRPSALPSVAEIVTIEMTGKQTVLGINLSTFESNTDYGYTLEETLADCMKNSGVSDNDITEMFISAGSSSKSDNSLKNTPEDGDHSGGEAGRDGGDSDKGGGAGGAEAGPPQVAAADGNKRRGKVLVKRQEGVASSRGGVPTTTQAPRVYTTGVHTVSATTQSIYIQYLVTLTTDASSGVTYDSLAAELSTNVYSGYFTTKLQSYGSGAGSDTPGWTGCSSSSVDTQKGNELCIGTGCGGSNNGGGGSPGIGGWAGIAIALLVVITLVAYWSCVHRREKSRDVVVPAASDIEKATPPSAPAAPPAAPPAAVTAVAMHVMAGSSSSSSSRAEEEQESVPVAVPFHDNAQIKNPMV